MEFQVTIKPEGYVVEALMLDKDRGERWVPLRNFGDRQGDAIECAYRDCPALPFVHIKAMANLYDKDVRYERVVRNRVVSYKRTIK